MIMILQLEVDRRGVWRGAAGGSEAQEEAGLGARVLRDGVVQDRLSVALVAAVPAWGDAVCWPLVH